MLLKKSLDVPMLPETANKVMALTQDPESNAQQLSAVIQSDPTIAGHVMRIANSSAYTPNSNLASIQQLIAKYLRLGGMRKILRLFGNMH
jgi:HD-like signal output (HDOD) protein